MEEIGKAYRATISKDAPPSGPERWKVVPPPPTELADLEQQREDAIMSEAQALKATLGAEAAAKIEKQLNKLGSTDLSPNPISPAEVERRQRIDQQSQQILQEMRRKKLDGVVPCDETAS